jgi:hypothetical protein
VPVIDANRHRHEVMEVAKRRPRHRARRYSTSNTRHTRR